MVRRNYTINDCVLIASEKDGQCISSREDIISVKSKLKWKCKNDHIFEMRLKDIIYGAKSWCRKCYVQRKIKYSIDDLKKFAKNKNGDCLSCVYQSSHEKLKWECGSGHIWDAPWESIRIGKWCPYCNIHVSENKCRFILEKLTEKLFPRTNFGVRNNDIFKRHFQIDCYNDEFKLGLEYQGLQHFKKVKGWNIGGKELDLYKQRDKEKNRLCKNMNINLFYITYQDSNKGDDYLIRIIKQNLRSSGINCNKLVEWNLFYINTYFDKYKKMITDKGGIILSNQYNNNQTPLKVRCQSGHEWITNGMNINAGNWCRECANNKRKMLDYNIIKQMINKGSRVIDISRKMNYKYPSVIYAISKINKGIL